MEIVAICGSPRKKGNTATILEAMLEGARSRGATTTRFDPAEMRVCDCDSDNMCLDSAEDECIQQDDMQQIYAALRRANVWVFATPVYFGHETATLKRVIDRLFAFYTREGGWRMALPGKRRCAVIVVQADASVPQEVADYLAGVLGDFTDAPILQMVEPDLTDPGDAAAKPDVLARARELGVQLAQG